MGHGRERGDLCGTGGDGPDVRDDAVLAVEQRRDDYGIEHPVKQHDVLLAGRSEERRRREWLVDGWSFTTVIAAPTSSPTLALPSDGATNQPVNLTLTWGTVVNAATYAVQVSTDPTFATTLYSQFNSAATTMALSSLSNSTTCTGAPERRTLAV